MSQRFIAGAVKFISDGHVQMVPQLNALAEDESDELGQEHGSRLGGSQMNVTDEPNAHHSQTDSLRHKTGHLLVQKTTNESATNDGEDTDMDSESGTLPCYCNDCIEEYGKVYITCHSRNGLDLSKYPNELTVVDCDCERYWDSIEGYMVEHQIVEYEHPDAALGVSLKEKVIVGSLCGLLFAAVLATFLILYLDLAHSGVTIVETVSGFTVRFSYGWTFTNGLYTCMSLWVLFKVIRRMFLAFSVVFTMMDESYQRNTITYIMELIWSTMVLIPMVNVFVQAYIHNLGYPGCVNEGTDSKTYCLIGWTYELHFLTLCFCCLYIFELILRASDMRKSLIVHHVATLGYTSYSVILSGTSASSFNVWNTTLGLFHGMFAMFEHPTFLALVCYRIYTKKEHLPWKAGTMNVAWMHFGLSKFASHVLGLWYYITFFNNFDLSVRITYPVFATIIFVAQIYSTWAQYNVYRRVENETVEYKKQKECAPQREGLYRQSDLDLHVPSVELGAAKMRGEEYDQKLDRDTNSIDMDIDLSHVVVIDNSEPKPSDCDITYRTSRAGTNMDIIVDTSENSSSSVESGDGNDTIKNATVRNDYTGHSSRLSQSVETFHRTSMPGVPTASQTLAPTAMMGRSSSARGRINRTPLSQGSMAKVDGISGSFISPTSPTMTPHRGSIGSASTFVDSLHGTIKIAEV